MALKLKVENKDFPKGHRFSIEGLGVFENGKEREVFAEQEQAFKDARRRTVVNEKGEEEVVELSLKDAFADDEMFTLSGDKTRATPSEDTSKTAEKEGDSE